MNRHYYDESQEGLSSEPMHFDVVLRNKTFRFHTDNGVFSKQYIDYGSKVLIESVLEPSVDGDILDVGCGYGPIGIALASFFPHRNVMLADVNGRALNLATQNIIQNQVQNAQTVKSNVYENITSPYAMIVTNPPIRAGKGIVFDIFEGAYDRLIEHGVLYVVIQKKQGAPSAIIKLQETFGNCEIVNKSKGYYILKSLKTNVKP